jgi:hypothetical protein
MTELTFPRAHPNSLDPVETDLFSGSRFTKHCKRALPGVSNEFFSQLEQVTDVGETREMWIA